MILISMVVGGCAYPHEKVVLIEPCYVAPVLLTATADGSDQMPWGAEAGETRRFVALGGWREQTDSPVAAPVMLSDAGSGGAEMTP